MDPHLFLIWSLIIDASKFLQWSLITRETDFTSHRLKAVKYFAVQHLSHQSFSVVTTMVAYLSKVDYKQ